MEVISLHVQVVLEIKVGLYVCVKFAAIQMHHARERISSRSRFGSLTTSVLGIEPDT